ncbi:hypothetical protein N7540_004286 [Penicillium herquei]|nr:hypothetical protein N7540_004286 [Penicillium herquei]
MPSTPPFNANLFADLYPGEEQIGTTRFPSDTVLFPASYRHGIRHPALVSDSITTFLRLDLSVERLTRIHRYLWLAGQPSPSRPLNYHISTKREIVLDERIHLHLVLVTSRQLYLKPLPRYLLHYDFWDSHLVCKDGCECGTQREHVYCEQGTFYQDALGFLYSYISLIQYESDFIIAQDHRLLPSHFSWESWVLLVQQLLTQGIKDTQNINPRYKFGELRLDRLNSIYMVDQGISRYMSIQNQTFSEKLQAYLTPISAITVYFALVLTAMQVGLATDQLNQNLSFHRASYGFAILSILGPLVLLSWFAISGLLSGLGFVFSLLYTFRFMKMLGR